jgi:hypothetical protein
MNPDILTFIRQRSSTAVPLPQDLTLFYTVQLYQSAAG